MATNTQLQLKSTQRNIDAKFGKKLNIDACAADLFTKYKQQLSKEVCSAIEIGKSKLRCSSNCTFLTATTIVTFKRETCSKLRAPLSNLL